MFDLPDIEDELNHKKRRASPRLPATPAPSRSFIVDRYVSCPIRTMQVILTTAHSLRHTCGHRQVVRHQLPKLTLAGSSPVARSRKMHKHGSATLPCFLLPSAGTRTRQGASVKQTRSVCSEQARPPIGDRSRCAFAKQMRGRPVAHSSHKMLG